MARLDFRAVDRGGVERGDAQNWGVEVVETFLHEHDVNAEVLDLRSIRPLDEEAILASVRKTHRAVCIEENKPFCGIGAQISSMLMEKAFDDLDAPVLRVTSLDAPAIYSPKVEPRQLPRPTDVVDKVLSIC